MAPTVKMAALVAVAGLFLLASTDALGSATEVAVADMMPVSPAENVMAAVPGGGVRTLCLTCRCCSSNPPNNCKIMGCCSTSNCNAAGKCNLVQKCGCSGCGGAN